MEKQYQIYKVEKGFLMHLSRSETGKKYKFSRKNASCFNLETAERLKEQFAKHNPTICDSDSNYFKFISRAEQWKANVEEEDPLLAEKLDKLDAACDLCYPDETLDLILNATTENEIRSAMKSAREKSA